MKLNQELIKRLADGEIAYQHTGTDAQWEQIKTACDFKNKLPFCKEIETPIFCSKKTRGNYFEYYVFEENTTMNLPTYTTEQFYKVETKPKIETQRDWHDERPTAILSIPNPQPQAKKFRLFWGLLEFEY